MSENIIVVDGGSSTADCCSGVTVRTVGILEL